MKKVVLLLAFMIVGNSNLFAKELTLSMEIKKVKGKGSVYCDITKETSKFTTRLEVRKFRKKRPKVSIVNNPNIQNINASRRGRRIRVKYSTMYKDVNRKFSLSFNKRGKQAKLREIAKVSDGGCIFKFGPVA